MARLIILTLLLSLVFASQYVPIVKREVGIPIGNLSAEVKIDLIYDPVCDDSADFDARLQQAWSTLSTDIQNRILLRFISLPLPYHIAT